MSVNSYTRGCHLLNHDDVIGTRRVSYILYMPLPYNEPWRTEYGGALELYPVQEGAAVPEPQVAPVKSIPPSWNQFVFFEVQPGKSFHSVEEVVVDEEGHARLSISGWFHAAQPGEDGYVAEQTPQASASSRAQLVRLLPCLVCRDAITDARTDVEVQREHVCWFVHTVRRHERRHRATPPGRPSLARTRVVPCKVP